MRKRKQWKRTFLKQWREHRGMSQEQLAEAAGTTHATVSRIERGAQAITQGKLEAFAVALRTTTGAILNTSPVAGDELEQSIAPLTMEERRQVMRFIQAIRGDT